MGLSAPYLYNIFAINKNILTMATKKMSDGTTVTTRSTSETGHAKNVAAFKDLLQAITDLGTAYQPSNESISVSNLNKKNEAISKAMDNWRAADRADQNAENLRTDTFSGLNTYSTRIVGVLSSSSNVSPLTLKDAQSIMTKVRGKRSAKGAKEMEQAKISGEEQPRTISVSQQSFDQKTTQFSALKKLVETQPTYKPNEADLNLKALTDYEIKLNNVNGAKVATQSQLIDARNQRNFQLYDPQTGVVALSKIIKNYIKGRFQPTHVTYKKINGIPFKTIKDKASKL
jgi:hypothetical protein